MSWRRELRQAVRIEQLEHALAKAAPAVDALEKARADNRRLREENALLKQDNSTLLRFVPKELQRCAFGFVQTAHAIADIKTIEEKP